MTNAISIWLGLLIVGFLVLDHYVLDWEVALYLGRKLLEFVEYIAFWR